MRNAVAGPDRLGKTGAFLCNLNLPQVTIEKTTVGKILLEETKQNRIVLNPSVIT